MEIERVMSPYSGRSYATINRDVRVRSETGSCGEERLHSRLHRGTHLIVCKVVII